MKKIALIFLTIALISSLSIVLIALKNPQSLYSDTAWQMKALQQFIASESPSFNHLVRPSYDDLAVNEAIWITWWPPGTNLLAYPLLAGGISTGISIRIIAIAGLILGSLGWICWFSLFEFPIWIGLILAVTIPTLDYGSHAVFQYSAELLVYASAPWLLLMTYQLNRYWNRKIVNIEGWVKLAVISAGAGLILGFGYILKYSILFVLLGALIYLGFQSIINNNFPEQKISKLIAYGLVCLFFAIPLLGINLLNQNLGGTANLLTATAKNPGFKWQNLLYSIANPALAMADGESFWKTLLVNTQQGLVFNPLWIGLIGLPGGLLLLWLILRPQILSEAGLLAKIVFFTSIAALFAIWSLGATVSYDPRHVASASLAILPVVLESGCQLWEKSDRNYFLKVFLGLAAVFYLGIPLVYSSVSTFSKAIAPSHNYKAASSQIYNPWLASQDLRRVRAELLKDFNEATDIWYVPEALSALDLPGRAIVTHADFYGGLQDEILQQQDFHTSIPLRVRALLPSSFEENGKGLLIRASFVQASQWIDKEIEGCNYILWTSSLINN